MCTVLSSYASPVDIKRFIRVFASHRFRVLRGFGTVISSFIADSAYQGVDIAVEAPVEVPGDEVLELIPACQCAFRPKGGLGKVKEKVHLRRTSPS